MDAAQRREAKFERNRPHPTASSAAQACPSYSLVELQERAAVSRAQRQRTESEARQAIQQSDRETQKLLRDIAVLEAENARAVRKIEPQLQRR
jgi:hypothetical protein